MENIIIKKRPKKYLLNKLRHKSQSPSQEFFKAFNFAPIIVAISTIDTGQYIFVNDKFLTTLGYTSEEVLGKTSEELNIFLDYADRQKAKSIILEKGKVCDFESKIITKDQTILTVLFYGEIIELNCQRHLLTTAVNITRQKELERRVAFSDRLNLLGEMAATIAHEVRNPLTTIRGFLQLEQRKQLASKDNYNIMIEEIDRANEIITEYLALAKPTEKHLEKGSLNKIIKAITPLIQSDAIKDNKTVVFELQDIPSIPLNPKEIKQLIFNLVRNGLEAMEERGTLTIRTAVTDAGVILEIADQGKGIPPEILEKLGQPFLTSKATGTGLGLPVCFRIAEKHDAQVKVKTSSTGTTFIIKFKIDQ